MQQVLGKFSTCAPFCLHHEAHVLFLLIAEPLSATYLSSGQHDGSNVRVAYQVDNKDLHALNF